MGFQLGAALSAYPGEFVVFAAIFLLGIPILGVVWVLVTWFLAGRFNRAKLQQDVYGRHCLVTGASKGLGKAIAMELAKAGADVTLFARGQAALDQAISEIKGAALDQTKQTIRGFSVDLTDYDSVAKALRVLYDNGGLPDWVIANAGAATPGFLADQIPKPNQPATAVVPKQIEANYLTSTNIVTAIMAVCKESAPTSTTGEDGPTKSGLTAAQAQSLPRRIVFVGSGLSILSFIGYSSYAASKHALRGFVDAIRTELLPFNVSVHQYLPANMETPGFEEEGKTKPKITAQIEGAGSTQSAESAAQCLLANVLNGRYYMTNELIIELARVSVAGPTPRPNMLAEVAATPILAVVFTAWCMIMESEILSHFKKKSA
ncbi:3-dehydrosphinganine reductase [Rhizophlyctis rosea]|nr:3-dehydrosphinganine reductase [Rhizophlyctis rosea]